MNEAIQVTLRVIGVLEQFHIPYHVGGSLASSIHGVPRQTRDVDLVVVLERDVVTHLVRALDSEFYISGEAVEEAIARRASFNVIHLESGFKVDLFVQGTSAFDKEEFSRAQLTPLPDAEGRAVYVKSAEDMIIRKLLWFREGGEVSERQWRDVLGLVKVRWAQLDEPYVRKWAGDLALSDLLDRVLAEA